MLHAVLPVKSLTQAKSRLASQLAPNERRTLVLAMYRTVLATLCAAAGVHTVWVVSSERYVLRLAEQAGARALFDHAGTLNAALDLARTVAQAAGARALLAIPADVPRLTTADVAALAAALPPTSNGGHCVLAPNQEASGTNALGMTLPSPMPFLFGADSYERHRQAARALQLVTQIYVSPTLAFDIDTPDDLLKLQRSSVYAYDWLCRCPGTVPPQ